jgi:excinuclease UvrABC nuclease subunit
MKEAARNLEFERAATIRDRIRDIRKKMLAMGVKSP